MQSYNKVQLLGNLTRDVELRYTPKGLAIAKFGLALNRSWRTDGGEQKEEVTFVDVDCFGKQAENVGQYLRKGSRVHIEGRLKLDQWDDKQTGQKRSKLGVVVESMIFLDPQPHTGDAAAPRPAPRAAAPPAAEPPTENDDVPF